MANISDGKAVTHQLTLLGERCEITVFQSSRTVFIAQGDFRGHSIEGRGGTRAGALGRWRHLAQRSQD